MAELTTIARPYAKAAFEYALASGELQKWSTMLGVAAAVSNQDTVKTLLSSPSLTKAKKAELFFGICAEQLDEKACNFISALATNKRLILLPEIVEIFEQLKANQEKTIDVDLVTAYELEPATYDNLTQSLSTKLSRDIHVNATVDSNLLGGVVVRAGDTVIDGSIRGKLAKLAEQLNG